MIKSFTVNVNNLAKPMSEESLGRILVMDNEYDLDYATLFETKDLPEIVSKESRLYKLVDKLFTCSKKLEEIVVVGDSTMLDENDLAANLELLIEEQKSDWFFLTSTMNDNATIKKISAFVDKNDRVYFVTTQDLSIIETIVGENTAIGFHDDETDFLAEGLAVNMSVALPGSITAKFEQIRGSEPANITLSELKSIHRNNGFSYIRNKGIDYVSEGKMADGNYIDLVLGSYFIKFKLEEALFMLAINNGKIGYDDKGIGMMTAATETALKTATNQGIILEENGQGVYEITALRRNQVSKVDVSNRRYNGLSARATVAGAIHDGEVNINLVTEVVKSNE